MTKDEIDPFILSGEMASEFEEILEVKGLASQIRELGGGYTRIAHMEKRDFAVGEVISMAGLFVSLVALMLQIRSGHAYQNESRDKISERLILKISEESSLPPKARERLINKLIDKIGV